MEKKGLRIAIIGAGWFGCHIGLELLREGCEIDVYESRESIFLGASGNNQNRLHLGFHYPRSFVTREQSQAGYQQFLDFYPDFALPIEHNIYAVADDQRSHLDFGTYLQIMQASGLSFEQVAPADYGLMHTAGAIACGEKLIDIEGARQFFLKSPLAKKFHFNTRVESIEQDRHAVRVNGKTYDHVINCTWQQLMPNPNWHLYFEPCVSLVYETKIAHPAVTMMDGPFFTIYPFYKNFFTVYSVAHTRRGIFSTADEAIEYLDGAAVGEVNDVILQTEAIVKHFYPAFKEYFKFSSLNKTVRTISRSVADHRDCRISKEGRIIQILSGKVDHIFLALDGVKKCLSES